MVVVGGDVVVGADVDVVEALAALGDLGLVAVEVVVASVPVAAVAVVAAEVAAAAAAAAVVAVVVLDPRGGAEVDVPVVGAVDGGRGRADHATAEAGVR